MAEDSALAFHAAPPPGEWINDPNALVFADGAYRLFVQHRADAPAFRATGWARFSSPDLLRWTFDGPAIAPEGDDWMYSGSMTGDGETLLALHTLHTVGQERQVRRVSTDAGASWSAAEPVPSFGEATRNRRDPYIFRDADGWALLLAEPCDWRTWRDDPASRLSLYRSDDARTWREAGTIGPWHPPGVMWEVPLLARIDGRDVLFVSTVDRRDDGAECAVRAWIGTLHAGGFTPDPDGAPDGQLVDSGPDFYAMMGNVEQGWPAATRAFVAWAASWSTARATRWPGFHGGPITLSRSLAVERRAAGPWLASRPMPAIEPRFAVPTATVPRAGRGTARYRTTDGPVNLTIRTDAATVEVTVDHTSGILEAIRTGGAVPRWTTRQSFAPADVGERTVTLFVDGPLVELFLLEDGVTLTVALAPGDAAFAVEARTDAPIRFDWSLPG